MIFTSCSTCNGWRKLYTRVGPNDFDEKTAYDCHECKGTGKEYIKCCNCNENAEIVVKPGLYQCNECYEETHK